jgi:hypothetical protein
MLAVLETRGRGSILFLQPIYVFSSAVFSKRVKHLDESEKIRYDCASSSRNTALTMRTTYYAQTRLFLDKDKGAALGSEAIRAF